MMAEKDGKTLGARIRRFRELADLSQSQLGEKLGVSYQQIQKYERGASRLSVETLLRLAKVLNLPVQAMLPGGDGPESGAKAGHVNEPRPEYGQLARDEKEWLKAYRDLGDEKVKAAFLTALRAVAAKRP
jgi:transcriptional regulator with XRE-family HTH domain